MDESDVSDAPQILSAVRAPLSVDAMNAVLSGTHEVREDSYGNQFVTEKAAYRVMTAGEKIALRKSLKAYIPLADEPMTATVEKPTWIDRFKGRANRRTEYLRMTTLFLAVAIFWITIGITDIVQDVNSGTGWWGTGAVACFVGVAFGFMAGLWASMIDDERSY